MRRTAAEIEREFIVSNINLKFSVPMLNVASSMALKARLIYTLRLNTMGAIRQRGKS